MDFGGGSKIVEIVAELNALHLEHHRRLTGRQTVPVVTVEPVAAVAALRPKKTGGGGFWKKMGLSLVFLSMLTLLVLAVNAVIVHVSFSNSKYKILTRTQHISTTSAPMTNRPLAPAFGPFHAKDCAERDWISPANTSAEIRLQHFCLNLHPSQLIKAKEQSQWEEEEFRKLKERMSVWELNDDGENGEDAIDSRRNRRSVHSPHHVNLIFRANFPKSTAQVTQKSDESGQDEAKPVCPLERVECDADDIYRSMSGRCNNLEKPDLGKNSVPLTRMLPAIYDDDRSALRKWDWRKGGGGRLPNPRLVSTVVHDDDPSSQPDAHHTLALMQWGQFLAHDVAMTPKITGPNGLKLKCDRCLPDFGGEEFSPCSPIPIPKGDPFFPSSDIESGQNRCIPFTRSLPSPQAGVDKLREQMNVLTAFVDSSNVYGSDECKSRDLRQFDGGQLKVVAHPMSPRFFKPLMPRTTINQECTSPTGKCFFAGEERNSEQPGLTSLHTLMVREHNRLAQHLALENPHWNDEKLFQEARKIVIAINQHITYNEFLPRVLGPDLVEKFGIASSSSNSSSGKFEHHHHHYDSECSPDVSNEFATAAFRFGHSLIRPQFYLMNKMELPAGGGERNVAATAERYDDSSAFHRQGSSSSSSSSHQHHRHHHLHSAKTEEIPLKNHFFNPDVLFRAQTVDRLMRGVLSTPMERFDSHVSKELTNHLFQVPGVPFSGMDLAAINIQRGRDHGLQGYVQYLKLTAKQCYWDDKDIGRIDTFQDLANVIGENAAAKLSRVYRSVHDIDLFTGGLSEPSIEGGVVGKTFGCIIGQQFQRLKRCDRFWHQTTDAKLGFTPDQLEQIQATTLSGLLCRNWDDPSAVQRSAFDLPSDRENPIQDCADFGTLELMHWRDVTSGNANDVTSSAKYSAVGSSINDVAFRTMKVDGDAEEEEETGDDVTARKSCPFKGLVIPVHQAKRVAACTVCRCHPQGKVSCKNADLGLGGRHRSCHRLQSEYGLAAVVADRACRQACPEPFTRYENPYQVPLNVSAI